MTIETGKLYRCECVWCGETFFASRRDAKTDKSSCRLKLSRWRKKLLKHHSEIKKGVDEIKGYLSYPLAQQPAIDALLDIEHQIQAIYHEFKIVKVK